MSYLGYPRLHFSGTFQADPSTVNNDPYHFNVAQFRPGWDEPGPGATKGWWNPGGTGAWRLKDCTVRSVVYADGTSTADPLRDSIVGRAVNSATERVAAKMVDLDSEQQMVSQIWGLQVQVPDGFAGEFEVAAFADIWIRFSQGQPDSFFSATYQSVLTDLEWAPSGDSRWLQELGAGAAAEHQVHGRRLRRRRDLSDVHVRPHLRRDRPVRRRRAAPPRRGAADAPARHRRRCRHRPRTSRRFASTATSSSSTWPIACRQTSVGGPLLDVGRLRVALLPADGAADHARRGRISASRGSTRTSPGS